MSDHYVTKSLVVAATLRLHKCEPIGYEVDKSRPGYEPELAVIFERTPALNAVVSDLRTDQIRVSPFAFAAVFGETRKDLLAAKYAGQSEGSR